MIRLLADEDFNGPLLRAFKRRWRTADVVRVQEVGLMSRPDSDVLDWAKANGRIVLTHDVRTMVPLAYARLARGESSPGVFVVAQHANRAAIADDLVAIAGASTPDEWADRVTFLPL